MVRALQTRDDYWEAVLGGNGVIVIVDKPTGSSIAHPVDCPTLDASQFVEKVVTNRGRHGSYHWAASMTEAARECGAQPCQCQ